ncbi:DUF1269 domain-containing protein [Streptomyces sp. VRA16 Mangrove soil]|uniref:DUF1269 domain-containing protein n=1 Tax=Streptomyces sp. VRA16 Mangrove soil TaxID=2817434 RepID=UPI001A9E0D62|nr:DUF1269 domain-containing protein [Streptomyces sp. VRA16 Mangrove soil]MBO1332138.1 DUF1269 domain-containing protein [Streptomyces sp. VRA16 Mangrove soil]
MTGIGPVQLLTVEFGPDAKFEGRIMEELSILEANGQIRVLDVLFVSKESSGDLFSMDYQAEGMGETVAGLLGISGEQVKAAQKEFPSLVEGNAFGLSLEEIRETADALDPGTAAAFVLLEHVWAKYLRTAIRDAGGVPVAEGFLTEEALAPVAEQVAAAAERLGDPVDPNGGEKRKARHHPRRP